MSLKGFRHIAISKEKFDNGYSIRLTNQVEQQKIRDFINENKHVFSWKEETNSGKYEIDNIDKLP